MRVIRFGFCSNILYNTGGISLRLMTDFLNLLPADTTFVGCGYDQNLLTSYMCFSSEEFEEVLAGQLIPEGTIYFKRDLSGNTFVESLQLPNKDKSVVSQHWHIWAKYKGLMQEDEFCIDCGAKKDESQPS